MRLLLKYKNLLYSVTLFIIVSVSLPAQTGTTDLSTLETNYFNEYHILYKKTEKFVAALTALTPPNGFSYAKENLTEYNALLDAMYKKKPEYRELTAKEAANDAFKKKMAKALGVSEKKWGLYEKARDLAKISGLPHRELAVYQKANGMYGLKKLVYSVTNLQNKQWISWYLMLNGNGNAEVQKLLFLDKGESHPQLAAMRLEFGTQAKIFNQSRGALYRGISTALKSAADVKTKNKLWVKLQIYQYIARQAGKVGWLNENLAGYPLKDAVVRRYPKAAKLAEKLEVDFSDMAFLKRKTGNYGLKKMLRKMTWVKDIEKLIADTFD